MSGNLVVLHVLQMDTINGYLLPLTTCLMLQVHAQTFIVEICCHLLRLFYSFKYLALLSVVLHIILHYSSINTRL